MKWVNIEKRCIPTVTWEHISADKYEYGFYIYEKPEKIKHFVVSCHECGNSFCASCRYQWEKCGTTALENKPEKKWVNFVDYIKDKEVLNIRLKNESRWHFCVGKEREQWNLYIPYHPKINEFGIRFIMSGVSAIVELDGCQLRIEEDD